MFESKKKSRKIIFDKKRLKNRSCAENYSKDCRYECKL